MPPDVAEYFGVEPRTPEELEAEFGPGAPPPEGDLYHQYLVDFGIDEDDLYGQTMLYEGWFDFDIDPDRRQDARRQFFQWTGLSWDDFTAWKDWYEWMIGQLVPG